MNNTIYEINYWTNQYYEKDIWDKYHCKTFHSMIKKLKSLLIEDWFTKKESHLLCMWLLLDYKTVWRFNNNINIKDLYINISTILIY
jgi:hypothetical protein